MCLCDLLAVSTREEKTTQDVSYLTKLEFCNLHQGGIRGLDVYLEYLSDRVSSLDIVSADGCAEQSSILTQECKDQALETSKK